MIIGKELANIQLTILKETKKHMHLTSIHDSMGGYYSWLQNKVRIYVKIKDQYGFEGYFHVIKDLS